MRFSLFVVLLFCFVGCGGPPAPLCSKGAKWFDFTDQQNAKLLPQNVTAHTLTTLKQVKLDLGGNENINDADLGLIKNFKNLAMIDLYMTSITDQAIEQVVDLPLEVLVLSQSKVGDATLASVGKIKTLRRLELFDTKITDAGLKYLVDLPLFRIDLSKTAVTDQGIAEIAKIKGLERLIVSETSISDAGLAAIGTIETLRELNVYNAGAITDVGLKHLHNLKALKALFLGESKFSPEGLSELRKALPNCEIAANN